MAKRILIGIAITLISGGLVYGAIVRTQARVDHADGEVASRQYTNRLNASSSVSGAEEQTGEGRMRGRNLTARGQSSEIGDLGGAQRSQNNTGTEASDWLMYQGIVQEVSDESALILTEQGESIVIEGRAFRFVQEQGFNLVAGQSLKFTGYFEDGEFIVAELLDLRSGLAVTVREDGGRPLWAGGRNGRGL